MIRRIQVFETADGKRFDDEKRAIEHVADTCREYIAKRLDSLCTAGSMTKNDVFRVVMALVPDAATAAQLADELARMTGVEDD